MNDYVQIKKSQVLFILIVIISFVAGFFLSRLRLTGNGVNIVTTENDCKEFCFLADAEYSHIGKNDCYCNKKQIIYNKEKNETITVTQTMNAGIIKSIEREKGLFEEARNILVEQQ